MCVWLIYGDKECFYGVRIEKSVGVVGTYIYINAIHCVCNTRRGKYDNDSGHYSSQSSNKNATTSASASNARHPVMRF